jgi:hypothetical protein
MIDLTAAPRTDPSSLYRTRDELYADDLLIAALNGVDFFTWLDGRSVTIDEIAAHFGFHARPVDVMTTLFVAKGLLERDGDRVGLTDLAREHLVRSSRWFLGPYFPPVTDRPIAVDLLEILRTDRPANFASRKDAADWHKAMETEQFAEAFTAAMDRRGQLLAQALAKNLDLGDRQRLLDIAGGSGVYACGCAARFPTLRGSVLEKAPVDRIASRAIADRGFRHARRSSTCRLRRAPDVERAARLGRADRPPSARVVRARDRARRADRHPRRVPERGQDRTGQYRRVLGAADARDAGTLLFDPRDGRAPARDGIWRVAGSAECRRPVSDRCN